MGSWNLRTRLADLIDEYGFDEVKAELDIAEDAIKERSCSDDRPMRADNE